MEKEENKKLEGRREFFKEAAKKALPILGAVALLSNPVIAKAVEKEVTDCSGNNCYLSCSGSCSGGCSGRCYNTCSGNCQGTCAGNCLQVCANDCQYHCKNTCRHSCDNGCATSAWA